VRHDPHAPPVLLNRTTGALDVQQLPSEHYARKQSLPSVKQGRRRSARVPGAQQPKRLSMRHTARKPGMQSVKQDNQRNTRAKYESHLSKR
jgi:hypothetical protein